MRTEWPPDLTPSRWILAAFVTLVAVTAIAEPVAAHGGGAQKSVPKWAFLGLVFVGIGGIATSVRFDRSRWEEDPKRTLYGVFFGAILVVVGTIALVEYQVEPLSTNATPLPRVLYPTISFGAGVSIVLGSVLLGLWRWPEKPAYIALGSLLGFYVAYPVLVPGVAVLNPAGYFLVFTLVALIAYVVWRDVVPGLRGVNRLSLWAGVGAAILFIVFALFSTGQFTLNPDTGVNSPTEQFVVVAQFANPLVMWPAVEFYFPSIPLFGALSVGTVITFALLGTLVGLNATLVTRIWQSEATMTTSQTTTGAIMTSGATACCCCAPAVYGVASALFGVSASPFYWMFLDSSSPLGSLFFVTAVALMIASGINLANKTTSLGSCPARRN
jgi:hypothetical protein